MSDLTRRTSAGKASSRPEAIGPPDRLYREQIRHLYRLGPRPVGTLLREVTAAVPEAAPVLAERLEVYAGLDPRLVEWAGANDWLELRDLIRAVGGT